MYNLKDIVTYNQKCNIYIAGPMSGLLNHNYPKFLSVEADLKDMGFNNILNPAHIANGNTSKVYSYYIRESLNLIKNADAVVFLNGWEKSKGAKLEYHCATTMGIPTFDENYNLFYKNEEEPIEDKTICEIADISKIKDETICQVADKIVSEDRMNQYGHPYHNFTDIGRVWGMILDLPDISPEKVGLMMIGLKIAREKFLPSYDNILDTIGYAKTIDMCKKFNSC